MKAAPPHLWRRLRRRLGLLAALLVLAWAAGFVWFVRRAEQLPPPPPMADGMVALTGGAGRIEAALRLLAQGRARLLLISGVARGADLADMLHRAGLPVPTPPANLAARITLGHIATTTRGNAEETTDWVRAHDIRSLIVVTSNYHMLRALTELGHALPDVALYPVPVAGSGWRLLALEYTKFLAVEIGLSDLERARS